VMLLRSKPLRSTVNGLPFSDKINRRERALWRGSLRSREKREEPVTGDMRRNAGEDRAGTPCTEEHQWTQCRLLRDARLAKIMPGRNARFAGKLLLVQRCL